MLKKLPANVKRSGQSPIFTTETTPTGILNWHETKEFVWGEIVLYQGKATYEILTHPRETIELSPDVVGIIPPAQPHRLTPARGTEFQIIFYK